ncbi:hypothetical protein BJ508DRAFT_301874 [Ascobolus immersus RN42]|uniref:C2H2-type domain-containing protein n=1 Tax=Ascobolus immersus RN42 TaxID=1160509 RepID=A0A3N4IQL0_ASCIM|nr:hypothetical protein BJ508DRAFT_301874 [Ascobolus immersus RN42]
MRNHLQSIQCLDCGATFGQQSQFNEHKNRKTRCKPPKEGITLVTDEIKRLAGEMTECDNSDEGMMYGIMFEEAVSTEVLKAIYEALHILQTPRQPPVRWCLTIIPVAANKKEVRHRQLSERELLELEESDLQFLEFIKGRISISDTTRRRLAGNVQEYLGPPGRRPARRLPQLYTGMTLNVAFTIPDANKGRIDKMQMIRQLSVELTPADSGYASDGIFTPTGSEMSDYTECSTPSSAGYAGDMERCFSYGSNDGLGRETWARFTGPSMGDKMHIDGYGSNIPSVALTPFEKEWGSDGEVLNGWMDGSWMNGGVHFF